jgi:lipopolysaccharide export system permease protein
MEACVFGSILHRMILGELVKVFLMSLIGITGILLMAGIIAEASQQGLGPAQILAAIPLLIPSTLPYTIPATTLFATCVVYGRLAADNEILAIKSSGINVLKVAKPGIILGLAMSATTMGLYYRIIPYTHLLLRTMVFNDAEEFLYTLLKKHGMITHSQLSYTMFVKGVQGRKLLDPVFKKKTPQGKIDLVVSAKEAELRVDMTKRVLHVRMKQAITWSPDGSRAYLEDEKLYEVELPDDFGKAGQRRPRDMTWQEILENRIQLQDEIQKVRHDIARNTANQIFQDVPADLPKHIQNLNERLYAIQQQVLALDVELQMRPALCVGCLCFILVGCPVGIWFSRSDYLSSFITCFLPIVFIYYPLLLCGTGMAKDGRWHLAPLVWGADMLIGLIGLMLFWRLLKN